MRLGELFLIEMGDNMKKQRRKGWKTPVRLAAVDVISLIWAQG
jgi:hypothetical protein